MKGIGISLIVWGCIGILFGLQMFGDIGIACIWASVASILAGAGFLSVNKHLEAEIRNRQSKHSGGNPTAQRIPAWIPRRPRKRTKQYPQSQFPKSEESGFYFWSGKTLTEHSDSSP